VVREWSTLIYYKTGKPKRIDSYENDSLISGKCFNSKGKITIHSEYEKAPEFPGGSDKLIEYLEKEVHRSQKSTAGVVILSFYLNENGKVSKIKVIESINEEQDKEAIRVIKKMPKWTPLMVEGRATGCSLTLPVIWTN
jgi:TonB family protein